MPTDTASADLDVFAGRVVERTIGPCRLLVLPVVSWRGSFRTYPDFNSGEDLLQDLTVTLLDKGTERRDRFAVAAVLEDRGAQLSFSGNNYRVEVTGRALRSHLPDVFEVMAEQIRHPLFDATEFEKAQAQVAAALHRSLESTRKQANGALRRRLYPAAHPNYAPEPEVQLARLEQLTVDDVRRFHRRHFGATELILAVVGDVDADVVAEVVEHHLAGWEAHELESGFDDASGGQTTVSMPEKQNVDVRLGHALSVRRQDDDYLPLYLASYILGGNFSARLMATIRDEMGLTYGIGSGLVDVSTEYDGHWQVAVTLSQENLERGIEATREQVETFVREGATADELAEKKTTVTGSFKVALATTGGLATSLLRNAERGFPLDYLDRFPHLVDQIGLDQLNAAVREHLDPHQLHLAQAGHLGGPAAEEQAAP